MAVRLIPSFVLASVLVLSLNARVAGAADSATPPAYISDAVADPMRPDADRQRDADRKPAQILAFAGVKPGQRVLELIPGRGYFTRLLSAAAGPGGKVYAMAPPPRPGAPTDAAPPAAPVQAIAADSHYGNVTVMVWRVSELAFPPGIDLAWTSQNYHDFHNSPNVTALQLDAAVFKALKPGGIYLVLDHSAQAGSEFRDTSTLHRIDEAAVQKEVESVGFVFVAESDLLRNPGDPRTARVFDQSIRGHTDQFVLKFRKPQK